MTPLPNKIALVTALIGAGLMQPVRAMSATAVLLDEFAPPVPNVSVSDAPGIAQVLVARAGAPGVVRRLWAPTDVPEPTDRAPVPHPSRVSVVDCSKRDASAAPRLALVDSDPPDGPPNGDGQGGGKAAGDPPVAAGAILDCLASVLAADSPQALAMARAPADGAATRAGSKKAKARSAKKSKAAPLDRVKTPVDEDTLAGLGLDSGASGTATGIQADRVDLAQSGVRTELDPWGVPYQRSIGAGDGSTLAQALPGVSQREHVLAMLSAVTSPGWEGPPQAKPSKASKASKVSKVSKDKKPPVTVAASKTEPTVSSGTAMPAAVDHVAAVQDGLQQARSQVRTELDPWGVPYQRSVGEGEDLAGADIPLPFADLELSVAVIEPLLPSKAKALRIDPSETDPTGSAPDAVAEAPMPTATPATASPAVADATPDVATPEPAPVTARSEVDPWGFAHRAAKGGDAADVAEVAPVAVPEADESMAATTLPDEAPALDDVGAGPQAPVVVAEKAPPPVLAAQGGNPPVVAPEPDRSAAAPVPPMLTREELDPWGFPVKQAAAREDSGAAASGAGPGAAPATAAQAETEFPTLTEVLPPAEIGAREAVAPSPVPAVAAAPAKPAGPTDLNVADPRPVLVLPSKSAKNQPSIPQDEAPAKTAKASTPTSDQGQASRQTQDSGASTQVGVSRRDEVLSTMNEVLSDRWSGPSHAAAQTVEVPSPVSDAGANEPASDTQAKAQSSRVLDMLDGVLSPEWSGPSHAGPGTSKRSRKKALAATNGSEPVAPEVAAEPRRSPFGDETVAVREEELGGVRGGFTTPEGLKISFGIERAVYINGSLVSTTSLNFSDLDKIRGGASLPQGALAVIQSGPGNTFQTGPISANTLGTVVQNTLNDQKIQSTTVINATVNSLGIVNSMNAAAALRGAMVDTLRR